LPYQAPGTPTTATQSPDLIRPGKWRLITRPARLAGAVQRPDPCHLIPLGHLFAQIGHDLKQPVALAEQEAIIIGHGQVDGLIQLHLTEQNVRIEQPHLTGPS